MDTRESPVGVVASWAALVASFFLSFSTWVDLAELAGFTATTEVGGFAVRLSWFMAVAVDGYVVSALVTWMAPVSDEIARFAKANTYAGAAVGVLAQSAYHGLSVQHGPDEAWKPYLAAVVGALPPLAAGLSVHLRALVRRAHLSGRTVRTPDTAPVLSVEPDKAPALDAWTDEDVDRFSDLAPCPTLELVRPADMDPAWVQATNGHVPFRPDTTPVPTPRRPRPDKAWKETARRIMAESPALSHVEVAGKVLAEIPDLWPSLEAGRKAVSRLA